MSPRFSRQRVGSTAPWVALVLDYFNDNWNRIDVPSFNLISYQYLYEALKGFVLTLKIHS